MLEKTKQNKTAVSPQDQAFPQDQDGTPGRSQLFCILNHPSLILKCDLMVVRWLRSIHTSVTSPSMHLQHPRETHSLPERDVCGMASLACHWGPTEEE